MTTQEQTRPTIPAEEYADRWRRVQEMLAERDLDLLVAYADDRATFGAAHARWLADFPVHFEPACILVPLEGAPVMLVGPESDEYARLRGRIADVRVLRELTHPDEDYPFSVIQGLGEIVDDLGLDPRSLQRVGLAGRGLIGADTLRVFEAALPGVEWLDVENAVCDLRARKSPAEVAIIREAYRIADLGIEAAVEAIRPGVTERAVAAEIEAAMRRAGAEGTGIDTIVASGPNTRPILARSTFRAIAPDDMVLLTVAPRVEGYHAAIGRLVLVGDPDPRVRGMPWRWPSVPRRPARACCGPGSRVGPWRPRAGASWRTQVSARPSSTLACTAWGSSSSSRPSSAPAARPCCSRAWSSPSTSPCSTPTGAGCAWRAATS